jgi:type I restriction enzyme R subunit
MIHSWRSQEKRTPLLRLRYQDSIADALVDLGDAVLVGRIFAGCQKFLYQSQPAAA